MFFFLHACVCLIFVAGAAAGARRAVKLVSPHSIIFVFKANPNHVLRDEAARAAEEGRDYVSAQGIDQALQVRCASRAAPAPHSFVL